MRAFCSRLRDMRCSIVDPTELRLRFVRYRNEPARKRRTTSWICGEFNNLGTCSILCTINLSLQFDSSLRASAKEIN